MTGHIEGARVADGRFTEEQGVDFGKREPPGKRVPKVTSHSSAIQDVVCFSHLRWRFVYQRPQHLLTRCARSARVFFIEEPLYRENIFPHLELSTEASGVRVVVPHLPVGLDKRSCDAALRLLVDDLLEDQRVENFAAWYYSPMALDFSRHLEPRVVLYDCMDELSAFLHAPASLRERERELLDLADLVFTGGYSLYEAKRDLHPQVHAFPSSVDVEHFARARADLPLPQDQEAIRGTRVGFFGVIDERLDIGLLRGIASLRPDWQFIMLGPVVKIDPSQLPMLPNLHYLGQKSYEDLPRYLSGWDAAILPFALNESTRFISPTKTPEYLAAGKPVVSTPIRDVIRTYGDRGLVEVAADAETFVESLERSMARSRQRSWLDAVDACLAESSWDLTWARMSFLLQATAARVHGV